MGGRVLVIDDDSEYLDMIHSMLSDRFEVASTDSAADGLKLALSKSSDVVLLDIKLRERDGVAVCEELRNAQDTRKIKVVMLSALDDPSTRARAFSAGADDFIAKPFTADELNSRIFSKIRRLRESEKENDIVSCGNMILDLDLLEARIDGEAVHLTSTEFMIIKYFLAHPRKVISRADLLRDVWNGCAITERTIDSHVSSLREKLVRFDHELKTKHGVGYFLTKRS